MKNLLFFLILLFFISCETPYKIVETYTTDSTGKTTKTVQKIYSDGSITPVSTVVVSGAFWYDPFIYPYYRSPRIVVPIGPVIRGRVGGRRR